MTSSIDYFFSVASPWAYLGGARLRQIMSRFSVSCSVFPVDLDKVFARTGGLPFQQRSVARRRYRQLELARWSRKLGIPINLEPKFYPVDRRPASYLLIAARQLDPLRALDLAQDILRAIWLDEADISNWDTLASKASAVGFRAAELLDMAGEEASANQYVEDTEHAIRQGVFGSPSYVIEGEIFWGQDRLGFVAEKLMV